MSGAEPPMLARIRRALTTGRSAAEVAGGAAPAAAPARPAPADLAGTFRREAERVGVSVHGPLSPAAAREKALELVGPVPAVVFAWDEDRIGLPGLRHDLRAAGHTLLDARGSLDERPDPELARLATATVGLTGALAGLADTGSLVLASGEGRPRLAWLLPPAHVAVLRCGSLLPDLEAYLERHPQHVRESANVCIVTGPSRTGDIELTLTQGVHGPGRVSVVLVDE